MAFDLHAERYTVGEAARLVRVHSATIWHWILTGARGRKLSSTVIGGRRWVMRRDLEIFLAAGNESASGDVNARRQRADAAGKQLDGHGVRPR